MFDIDFYKKSFPLKKDITQGKLSLNEVKDIEIELEKLRDKAQLYLILRQLIIAI